MQNYVSLNVDYINFNQNGGGDGGLGGIGGGLSGSLVGGEKGEKGEKNRKSGEINKNEQNGEGIYKTIVVPFNIPTIDYVIENNLFIEIIDNINKNEILGKGKIQKYRFNGSPTDYDIYVEMENEDVHHVKKRGIMMRVKVGENQYKKIVELLKSINVVKIGGGGGGGGGGGAGDAGVHSRNAMNKKKKGFFSWLACFKGV
jgi:hypothetical protein